MSVSVCMFVCAQLYLKMSHCMHKHRQTLSVLRGMKLSHSPPSFGGEGISGAKGGKGQAKLSARLRGRPHRVLTAPSAGSHKLASYSSLFGAV